MKRGQFETIGLVFVVVLMIVGFVIYIQMSSETPGAVASASAAQEEAVRSYLIALTQTDVPSCGVDIQQLASSCIRHTGVGSCVDSCDALQEALKHIGESTLGAEGRNYSIRLEATTVFVDGGCVNSSRVIAEPSIAIHVGAGSRMMNISLCSA